MQVKDNVDVDRGGCQPYEDYVEYCERLGEHSLGHVHIHLGNVALKSYIHQDTSSLLPKRSSEYSLQFAQNLAIGPALCEGGVHGHHGDQHPCHQVAEGEGVQRVPGGAGNPPRIIFEFSALSEISPSDCDHVGA